MHAPLLVIVIMVKDESRSIVKTLLPYVQNDLKHICVFDTGSTDSTIEVTKSFFAEHSVDGFIDQEPFVDFATSRNRALEFAESHFPHATFFLMIDADWYINGVKNLLKFCEDNKTGSEPLYFVRLGNTQMDIASFRLFRVSARNRYVGVVHEVPELQTSISVDGVFFEVSEDRAHIRKSQARFKRDAELLLIEYEKSPFNSRVLFYLAQSYECLGDLKTAYKFYLKRSVFSTTNIEENAVTFFRLGYIAENLCLVDENFTWDICMEYYLKSFALRPSRIEALLAIAGYYLPKYPQMSFVYLKYACSVPYPKNDLVFVLPHMYKFIRYELLSACAWAMGEYALGMEATEKALKVNPQHQGLQQRLRLYETELLRLKADPMSASTTTNIDVPKTLVSPNVQLNEVMQG